MTRERERIRRISSGSLPDTQIKRVIDEIALELVRLQRENNDLKNRLDALPDAGDMSNYFADVRLLRDPEAVLWKMQGENPSITPGGATETVWPLGGTYALPGSATTASIVSASAGDTGPFTIRGLDANYEPIEATGNLTGTTPVVTTEVFLRVNNTTTPGNAGNVTVTVGGVTASYVQATVGRSFDAVFTIPANTKGIVWDWAWHVDDTGLVRGTLVASDGASTQTRTSVLPFGADGTGVDYAPQAGLYTVPEKTDLIAYAAVANKQGNPPDNEVSFEANITLHI